MRYLCCRMDDGKRRPNGSNPLTDSERELLEVHGFDLLAQVEAMLRHAREYQREVQRLRGILGRGQTSTADLLPLEAVREHVEQLRHESETFGAFLDDIVAILDRLATTLPSEQPPA
jgi:hypothetical protein